MVLKNQHTDVGVGGFGQPTRVTRSREAAMSENNTLTAQQIADHLGALLIGSPDTMVSGVEVIERATAQDLAFVGDAKQLNRVRHSQSQLVIAPAGCRERVQEFGEVTFLLVEEPEQAFLEMASIVSPRRASSTTGVSPTATIDSAAFVDPSAAIGHNVVVGADVTIGKNCRIEHGCVVGDGCVIGDNCVLYPNCVLYDDVVLGCDVILHASCIIGADGFGYRTVNGRHERLPHFGIVRIEDDVEIGAATTIDRAKVGETVIGRGTRIDNQVMIGHNCRLGEHNLIVSQVGFAGSASTGPYVVCGGQAGIADHVHLNDGCQIGAQAGVHRDMKGGVSYFGTPAAPIAEASRQMMALRRLPKMRDTLKRLAKQVEQLHNKASNGAAATGESKAA